MGRLLDRTLTLTVVGPLVVLVVLSVMAGYLAPSAAGRALALAAFVLFVTAAFAVPQAVLAVALVGAVATMRVPFFGGAMSYADLTMILGTLVALRFAPRRDDVELRRVLVAFAVYFGAIAVVVAANPSTDAVLEWLHRLVLVPGPLLVGVALVRTGAVDVALRAFVLVVGVVALGAVGFAVSSGGQPAYPFDINKNAAGLVMAFALVVTVAARHRLRWAPFLRHPVQGLLLAGLLATQSRGAALALALALVARAVLGASGGRGRQRAMAAGVVALVLMALVAVSVSERDLAPDASPGNAVATRAEVFGQALDLWREQPVLGAGVRYFTDPDLETSVAHNIVVNELGEAGVVGLAGVVLVLWVTWRAVRRSRSDLAMLGTMIFVVEVVAALLDVFWVAGRVGCAYVFIGMALAEARGHREPPASPARRYDARLDAGAA
ncbi:O-antigen ligase family protein [Rhabdothermincola salaria]|uniref:O-antigen ligase family protein n=1 Tax=Rhabdothermincola salaria TaxID=2903142 RepID=UPI001E56899C|nr:O-antigen ligase family protein [Rhabdothermincola salaria]MCD9622746.1 O-antigen ligase family protein [Rhabdothermincola salaria]